MKHVKIKTRQEDDECASFVQHYTKKQIREAARNGDIVFGKGYTDAEKASLIEVLKTYKGPGRITITFT